MTFRAGWSDRLDGKGYSRDYDRWPYRKQVAYEEGRRVAALAQHYNTQRTLTTCPNLVTRRPHPDRFPALLRVDAADERVITRRR